MTKQTKTNKAEKAAQQAFNAKLINCIEANPETNRAELASLLNMSDEEFNERRKAFVKAAEELIVVMDERQ